MWAYKRLLVIDGDRWRPWLTILVALADRRIACLRTSRCCLIVAELFAIVTGRCGHAMLLSCQREKKG